jgi:hypothetical protein
MGGQVRHPPLRVSQAGAFEQHIFRKRAVLGRGTMPRPTIPRRAPAWTAGIRKTRVTSLVAQYLFQDLSVKLAINLQWWRSRSISLASRAG